MKNKLAIVGGVVAGGLGLWYLIKRKKTVPVSPEHIDTVGPDAIIPATSMPASPSTEERLVAKKSQLIDEMRGKTEAQQDELGKQLYRVQLQLEQERERNAMEMRALEDKFAAELAKQRAVVPQVTTPPTVSSPNVSGVTTPTTTPAMRTRQVAPPVVIPPKLAKGALGSEVTNPGVVYSIGQFKTDTPVKDTIKKEVLSMFILPTSGPSWTLTGIYTVSTDPQTAGDVVFVHWTCSTAGANKWFRVYTAVAELHKQHLVNVTTQAQVSQVVFAQQVNAMAASLASVGWRPFAVGKVETFRFTDDPAVPMNMLAQVSMVAKLDVNALQLRATAYRAQDAEGKWRWVLQLTSGLGGADVWLINVGTTAPAIVTQAEKDLAAELARRIEALKTALKELGLTPLATAPQGVVDVTYTKTPIRDRIQARVGATWTVTLHAEPSNPSKIYVLLNEPTSKTALWFLFAVRI